MLKVTPTTTYDSAGSAKCGELYYQGSLADFSILCSFCEVRFLEYSVFLSHFKSVHFEKNTVRNSRRAPSSNKTAADKGVSQVRRPSLLTELVVVPETSHVEETTMLNASLGINEHDDKNECYSAIKQTQDQNIVTAQVTKKELNELRSQLKTELNLDLEKLEQRILALENDRISKKQNLQKEKHHEKDYGKGLENEHKKAYGKPFESKHEPNNKNDGITMATLPKYAFRNVEHFKTYEQLFKNNEKRFAELVSQFLNHVQVENSVLFIKLCWRKILQDKAAQHLCWRGTTIKQAIGSSVITAAIKDAYVSKFPQTSSDVEFEKTCIIYFQTAKKRFDAQSSRWHRSR